MAAALEQRDADRNIQRLLHERNIFAHELFLQRDRAGREHDFLPAADRGDQIRERLSDAGSGFDDRVNAFQDAALDELRHLHLARTRLEARQRARDRSAACEDVLDRRVHAEARVRRIRRLVFRFEFGAGLRVHDDRRDAARRIVNDERQKKSGGEPGNVRLPRNGWNGKRDDEIEHENPRVRFDEFHAGLAEFQPDREERAEETENRAARADGGDERRAEIDDAEPGGDERNHVDDEHLRTARRPFRRSARATTARSC